MTRIVIVGGGYGGVLTALGLARKFGRSKEISLTLIDKHDYQLFASNLYEVATADEELATVSQLKKTIALPYKEILRGKNVKFVKALVTQIHPAQKIVFAGPQKFEYDYLVLAAGSTSDYYNIEGAQNFSLPLKSLADAFAVRNQIEFAVQSHRLDVNKKNMRVVVAGGGYTGIEFAGELAGFLDIVAWKNQYPREKIEITIVEAQNTLLPGFSRRISQDAYERLQDLKVRVQLSSPIFRVDNHFVELVSGEKMEYDVLVWTTGVKASAVPFAEQINTDKKGRIVVNQFLQAEAFNSIFVLGDGACVLNQDGKSAPPTAQDAIAQAEYISYALPVIMKNQKPRVYQGQPHGYIMAIGGRWAILNYGGFYFTGRLAYAICELAHFNYYRKVVGWWKALKYLVLQLEIYGRND